MNIFVSWCFFGGIKIHHIKKIIQMVLVGRVLVETPSWSAHNVRQRFFFRFFPSLPDLSSAKVCLQKTGSETGFSAQNLNRLLDKVSFYAFLSGISPSKKTVQ
jgi:hypothetical protein